MILLWCLYSFIYDNTQSYIKSYKHDNTITQNHTKPYKKHIKSYKNHTKTTSNSNTIIQSHKNNTQPYKNNIK